jgi:hypothetical protein
MSRQTLPALEPRLQNSRRQTHLGHPIMLPWQKKSLKSACQPSDIKTEAAIGTDQ